MASLSGDARYGPSTALLVVDVQNDFADPGGSLYVPGGEDGYSGFTMAHPVSGDRRPTGLDDLLRERGVERVVVVGLALDYCVQATALDARAAGHEVLVLTDATRAVNVKPDDGERALDALRAAGVHEDRAEG